MADAKTVEAIEMVRALNPLQPHPSSGVMSHHPSAPLACPHATRGSSAADPRARPRPICTPELHPRQMHVMIDKTLVDESGVDAAPEPGQQSPAPPVAAAEFAVSDPAAKEGIAGSKQTTVEIVVHVASKARGPFAPPPHTRPHALGPARTASANATYRLVAPPGSAEPCV